MSSCLTDTPSDVHITILFLSTQQKKMARQLVLGQSSLNLGSKYLDPVFWYRLVGCRPVDSNGVAADATIHVHHGTALAACFVTHAATRLLAKYKIQALFCVQC